MVSNQKFFPKYRNKEGISTITNIFNIVLGVLASEIKQEKENYKLIFLLLSPAYVKVFVYFH